AEAPIERRRNRALGLGEQVAVEAGRPRLYRRTACEMRGELAPGSLDVLAPVAPRLRDGDQHLPERRQTVARLGRVIGPAEERPRVRRQEGRERPARAAGERGDG